MAFDPAQEEYRRLSLRFARTQKIGDAYTATRAAAAFRRRFAWNHDSLPQTDQDRAFHLVARASELVDRALVCGRYRKSLEFCRIPHWIV